MIRTVSIVPAILTDNKQDYRAQAERINTFTRRVQIDVTDGVFAQPPTLDVTNVWWPKNWQADLHLMAAKPSESIDTILKLNPSLCILHAEASEDLLPIFESLKKKVNISFWLAFNTVSRKNELEKNILKTITIVHTNTEKKKVFNYIEAVDISDLTIFD